MSDDGRLLADLEAGRVSPAAFGHEAHVRVAWSLLATEGASFADAYVRLRRGLSGLAARAGRSERYSETITLAFLSLVHQALAEQPAGRTSFEAFCREAPGLLDRSRLGRLYPAGLLDTAMARAGLILPPAGERP